MSTSYDNHREKVEGARRANGEFGTYAAGESGASLSGAQAASPGADGSSTEDRGRISALNAQIGAEERSLDAKRQTTRKLEAHDYVGQLRENGISRVTVGADEEWGAGLSGGGFVVSAESMDGTTRTDDAEEMLAGYSINANGLAEDFGLDKELDGSVEIDIIDDEWSLDNRDRLRAEADGMTTQERPKGPREALAEAFATAGANPDAYQDAVRSLDAADGIDSYPNEWSDSVDDRFPDDIDRRKAIRDACERLGDGDFDADSMDDADVFEAAVDRVAAGETNGGEVSRQASAIVEVDSSLERDFGDDVDAWDKARVMAHDRIVDGESAVQAYWNTKDHIEDHRADGKW